jgi:flavin reductase (DIM6/NTAB) family NADH-FMN oxidoreductase RutF
VADPEGADPDDHGLGPLVRSLDAGLVVVTAAAGDERDGCLVGFHNQVGMHPPRYVVWLSMTNRTYRLARAATHLAVHVVGAGDHALAEHFGGQTADDPGVDKLVDLRWTAGPGGAPLLADLPVRLVGRIVGTVEVPDGDHVGFVLVPVPDPTAAEDDEAVAPLRLSDVGDISAGHDP